MYCVRIQMGHRSMNCNEPETNSARVTHWLKYVVSAGKSGRTVRSVLITHLLYRLICSTRCYLTRWAAWSPAVTTNLVRPTRDSA